jgi:hypothetical protein
MTRDAILILGMHRSGTSALARSVALCGPALPKRLMVGNGDNEAGFWEPREIVAIHEEALAAAGSRWDDILAIDPAWFESDTAGRIRHRLAEALAADYEDAAQFVIKDPRLCRLLPLWLPLFAELGIKPHVIIPLRHPLEVARSLAIRDKFETDRSLMLWLRYLLDAERSSRDLPRFFMTFDTLLADPVTCLTMLAAAIDLSWHHAPSSLAHDLSGFLLPRRRHHLVDGFDDAHLQKNNPLVAAAWAHACAMAREGGSADLALFDRIATRLAAGEAVFARAIRGLQSEIADARCDAQQARTQLSATLRSRSWRITSPLRKFGINMASLRDMTGL